MTKLFSGSDKTKIFLYKVASTLHPLVALVHNSTTTKEQRYWPKSMPSKKNVQVSFVAPRKKMGNKAKEFWFMPMMTYSI